MTTKESAIDEINKWISSNETDITFRLTDPIQISIITKVGNFELILPSEKSKFQMIKSTDGKRYEWIDILNIYCIEKKPKIRKLLDKFSGFIKTTKLPDNPIKIDSIGTIDTADQSELDTFNIAYHREKTKVKGLIKTSIPITNVDVKIKQLFSNTIVADMIINEYMEVWKKFKVSLVNDNIYHWNIKLKDFGNPILNDSLKQISDKFGYDHIEFELMFDNIYYPNYPPVLKILRPRLSDSLMHRIANSKMLRFEYWDPMIGIINIIERVNTILNKWSVIDIITELNDIEKNKHGAYMQIEAKLLRLASYIDTEDSDEIDKDMEFVKLSDIISGKNKQKPLDLSNKKNTYGHGGAGWKPGTGYGHSGAAQWDIKDYIAVQTERDEKLTKIVRDILIDIQNVTPENKKALIDSISCSLLIKFIKEQLNSTTLLDMNKRADVYKTYLTILQELTTDDAIHLFHDTEENNLYNAFMKLKKIASESLKLDDTNEIANFIMFLYTMIDPVYNEYLVNKEIISNKFGEVKQTKKESNVPTDIKDKYKSIMEELKYDNASIASHSTYKYTSYLAKLSGKNQSHKRLSSEIPTLANDIPIHFDASIFLRVDDNPSVMRALITGPLDTPYDSGCFIFDIFIPQEYPITNPLLLFVNTGNKRFNPNLYAEGKVCLSILGTGLSNGSYSGPTPQNSEKWNSETSTLYQVLISIQAQILIENPYFNEPGHESYFGTDQGKKSDRAYNNNIRLYTMKHTILDLAKNPKMYPQFEDVFKQHFTMKKEVILKNCKKWTDDAKVYETEIGQAFTYHEKSNYADYEKTYNEIVNVMKEY
jgi:ubiquitin-protein ligase